MAIGSFRYYRLLFATAKYTTINEIGMYESNDGTGTNRLTGSTATSSGSYSGTTPGNSIDGNTSTYWESLSNSAGNWIAYDLGTAYTIKSLKVTSTTYPNEVPVSFEFQVSTNGSTWRTVGFFVFGVVGTTQTNKVQALDSYVGGVSQLDSGAASTRVLVYNWSTGALMGSATPASDGSYEWRFESAVNVLLVHTGTAGYEPKADGPVTPGT